MLTEQVFDNFKSQTSGRITRFVGLGIPDRYYLAQGVDSVVFFDPDTGDIWKPYINSTPALKFRQLQKYQELTNTAKEVFESEYWKLNDISLIVNPILGIFDSQKHLCPIGLTKYVPGFTLGDVLPGNMGELRKGRSGDADYVMTGSNESVLEKYIKTERERSFLADHGITSMLTLRTLLTDLDARLAERFQVAGIKLAVCNMKVDLPKNQIIITDLSSDITKVQATSI